MFQAREPHESLWQSEFLITPRKGLGERDTRSQCLSHVTISERNLNMLKSRRSHVAILGALVLLTLGLILAVACRPAGTANPDTAVQPAVAPVPAQVPAATAT